MTSPPPDRRRTFGPVSRSRLRDVDAAERALRLRAAVYSLAGFVIGSALAAFVWTELPDAPRLLLLLIPLAGTAAVYFGSLAIVSGAGRFGSIIYNPSGRTTPHLPEFSHAESLAARGRWEEAVRTLTEAAEEHPDDPRPLLRAARILRDEMGRFDEAAALFRRVRRERPLDPGMEMLVTREIAEIHLHHVARPRGAAPELARLIERFPGTPEAAWAESTLAGVKAELRAEERRAEGAPPSGGEVGRGGEEPPR